jgi:hypothetical protein
VAERRLPAAGLSVVDGDGATEGKRERGVAHRAQEILARLDVLVVGQGALGHGCESSPEFGGGVGYVRWSSWTSL